MYADSIKFSLAKLSISSITIKMDIRRSVSSPVHKMPRINVSNNVLSESSIDPKAQISFINPLHENYVNFSPSNTLQDHIHENKCNGTIKSKYFDIKQSPTSKTYEYNCHNKNIMSHTESESSNETKNKLERTTILPAF